MNPIRMMLASYSIGRVLVSRLARVAIRPGSVGIKTLAEQAISENLAGRILRVLGPVVEEQVPGCFTLRADTDTLAVVLQLLRSTLGLDPIRVLRRRINARQSEAAA